MFKKILLIFLLFQIFEFLLMDFFNDLLGNILGFDIKNSSFSLIWCFMTAYIGISMLKKKNFMFSIAQSIREAKISPTEALIKEILGILRDQFQKKFMIVVLLTLCLDKCYFNKKRMSMRN